MKSKEDLSLHYYYRVVGDVVVAGDLVWMTVANQQQFVNNELPPLSKQQQMG